MKLLYQIRLARPVVVLTNATTRLSDDLLLLGVNDEFDAVVNSAITGFPKPHAKAFEAAHDAVEQVLGATVKTSELLFIDDNADNVEAANQLGWAAITFAGVKSLAKTFHEFELLASNRPNAVDQPTAPPLRIAACTVLYKTRVPIPVSDRPNPTLDKADIKAYCGDMQTLPISKVKDKLNELVDAAAITHEQVTITKNGSPAAVLIGADEWESIQETLYWLSQPGIRESVAEADADITAGRVFDEAQIRAEFGVPKRVR